MKIRKLAIIIPIAFVLFIPCVILAHHLYTKDIQTKMFVDIADFSKLEDYKIGDAELVDCSIIYDYDVVDSYQGKVLYEKSEYEVYAFVFESSIDCFNYYSLITEQSSFDEYDVWNYCLCVGVEYQSGTYCDFVIYSENRLYHILGEDKDGVIAFLNWLNSDFAIELK